MDPPWLKLVFIKGPRQGETLVYKPGSIVQVGRIVRGNDIAIKDAGISTKHLRIWSDSGKWIIQDLGSSNGTILNSNSLLADTPFDLRHGDIIKLGEYTSIQVNTIHLQDDGTSEVQKDKLPPRPRRNNRRQTVDLDLVGSVQENPTRRGRSSKRADEIRKENGDVEELPRSIRVLRGRNVKDIAEDVKVMEKKDEYKVTSRVRRTGKNDISVNSCVGEKIGGIEGPVKQEEMQEEEEETKGNSRVRTNRKTESTQTSCLEQAKLENEDITVGVEALEGKGEKRVSRRGTRSKKIEVKQKSGLDSVNVEIGNHATEAAVTVREDKGEKRVNLTVTRSKKNEIAGDMYLELEKIEYESKKRRRGRRKMDPKPLQIDGVMAKQDNENTDTGEEARLCTVKDDTRKEHGLGLNECFEEYHGAIDKGRVFNTENACSEAVNGCDEDEDGRDPRDSATMSVKQMILDLEKMTLGEWFDFLEVYLAKQITEETEKMIEAMRSKHKRVHKYIAEQKKMKESKPVE